MKKKLFQEVFTKAQNQSGKTSKHGISGYLEKFFSDELMFPVSKMTFVRYYEKYIEEAGTGGNNPNTDLLDKLCEYLDFENYEDFVSKNDNLIDEISLKKHNSKVSDKQKESRFWFALKKHKTSLIVGIVLLIGFMVIYSINKQRWMVWEGNKYIEISFDTQKYNEGALKLYNEDRIQNFKKITPSCETKFFDESGKANLWYGKNEGDTIEYFTTLGKHPETGKTLREITTYMVKKYICENH